MSADAWAWTTVGMVFVIFCGSWALTPKLMPPTTPFGVRVPSRTPEIDAAVARAGRGFAWRLGAAALLVALAATSISPPSHPAAAVTVTALGGTVLGMLAYYWTYHELRTFKRAQDWYRAVRVGAVAHLNPPDRRPRWDAFQIAALAIVAGLAVMAILRYPALPARLPVHFGINGVANRFAAKSVAALLAVVGIPAALALALAAGAHWLPTLSAPLDPAAPEASAEQQAVFVHRTQMILGGAADLVAIESLLIALAMSRTAAYARVMPIVAGVGLPVLLVAFVLTIALRTGQGGHRINAGHTSSTGLSARDDDRLWWAGQLYVNRDDPAFLVPKRVGFGYTLNFGHPGAWLAVTGLVGLAVLGLVLAAHP